MDSFTLTLLTAVGTGLSGAIGALWIRDGQWRKDYNEMVEKMQAKIDATSKDAITAINSSANQANSFAASLVSIQGLLTKMDERWANLEKEILRGRVK